MAIGGQHHVRRFDVAVDDSPAVREMERFGDLSSDPERFVDGQAAARQARLERDTLHELHREEGPAVMLADFIDLADERMIELRRGLSLAEQPPAASTISACRIARFVGAVGQEKLERDASIEREIFGGVDFAHPALADAGLHAVVRELFACHPGRRAAIVWSGDGGTQAG